jgi:coenzyme F420-0:L-glutamate ligase/coenzyme F420-1:gamma-L-glutamate ligase
LEFLPLKSRLIKPKTTLLPEILASLKKAKVKPQNGDILAITSKVVSVSQNRIVPAKTATEELKIAKKEADHWLGGEPYPFSLKEGILIPRSGVDASNCEKNKLILWPRDLWGSTRELHTELKQALKLTKLGVILTDSTCRPLRWGVSNIALAWVGFNGVRDQRGAKDLYGRRLKVTQQALADSLAAAAGVLTGEAAESIPFVLIRGAPVKWTNKTIKPKAFQPRDCLFAPVYTAKLRNLKI